MSFQFGENICLFKKDSVCCGDIVETHDMSILKKLIKYKDISLFITVLQQKKNFPYTSQYSEYVLISI